MIQFRITYTIYYKLINFSTKINILIDIIHNIYVYFKIFLNQIIIEVYELESPLNMLTLISSFMIFLDFGYMIILSLA